MSGSSHSSPASAGGPAVSPLAAGGGDYNFDLSQLKPPPSFTEKLWSKTKQDPLVPIGFIATCAALTGGIISMARSRSHDSQMFMRLRVGAQAFTLAAVMFAIYNTQRAKSATEPAAAAEPEEPSLTAAIVAARATGQQPK